MRISDWSSDVCSSDLATCAGCAHGEEAHGRGRGCVMSLRGLDLEDMPTLLDLHLRGLSKISNRLAALAPEVPSEIGDALGFRPEERRVGKECVSTCRSRGSPYH